MPRKKTKTSKNVSNTKKQVVKKTRQNAVNVGNGAGEEQISCHQCGGKGEDGVICQKCGSNRYCVDCKTEWYPDVSKENFVKSCPVCCSNCNCNTCLHDISPEGYSCSEPDKIQYSKQLLQKVFPLLKNLNEESHKIEIQDVRLQNEEFEVAADVTCDNCGTYFFGIFGSCSCGYDLCIVCFHELCDGHLQWKCRADGSIPCPPKDLNGCGNGTFKLKRVMLDEDGEDILKKAQKVYERIGSGDDIPETCSICSDGMQEKSDANFLDSPSANMKHFEWHWSKGETIMGDDVLSDSSGLSWEPMVLWRAFSEISKSGNRPRSYKVNTTDCLDGRKVSVYLHEFLSRYSEGGSGRLLKLESWQPPCFSQGKWPRHFAEFISCLPFKEYTHPHNGYFNVASDVSSEFDMGPRMDIAYGTEEELEYEDSVTNLHYDKSDTVNVMTHTKSAPHLSTKVNKKKTGKRKHEATVSKDEESVGDLMVEGALWDIFQRQDVTKLKTYLWNHSADFKLAACPSAEKDFFPIHDSSIYLNMEHKRKLKEEFGIEPWSFKQKLGAAVIIPAGCPYQVRNLKPCMKVELNFISPESLGACILLQKELRMLPTNHKAKQQMLNIGKMMMYALKRALTDLSSNGPIDDHQFAKAHDINDNGANISNHGNGWIDPSETEASISNHLGQEQAPNEWIDISSTCSHNESPPLHTTDHVVDQEPVSFEDPKETEEVYRGNVIGMEAKKLLQAVELQYPNMFNWGQIRSAPLWPETLTHLYKVIKDSLETSVEDLLEEDQIRKLEEKLSALKSFGFDLSWIEKKLDMVNELRFELSPELMVLQESLEPLKTEVNEIQRQFEEVEEKLGKARIKYEDAKKGRIKLRDLKQKYGDELVLSGPIGSGMLPGYIRQL